MKKTAIITVSLLIGIIIGYLYKDYHSEKQEEVKKEFIKDQKRDEYVSTPRNEYHTRVDDWEDIEFQGWDNFGPV